MSDYEIDAADLGGIQIPNATMAEQKQAVADIESRIAQGEAEADVLKNVFDRLEQTKH
jgi:hypothetical protein